MNHLKLLGRLLMAIACLALMASLAIPKASAEMMFSTPIGVSGLPALEWKPFTNTASGVSSIQRTNSVIALTNGTTTVTSAPVALRNGGVLLGYAFTPTNALLTNVVTEWQFSMDAVNWGNEPLLLWRVGGAAFAANTSYTVYTNLPREFIGNYRYARLNKVYVTNGVNNVGNIFITNGIPSSTSITPTNGALPFSAQTFL